MTSQDITEITDTFIVLLLGSYHLCIHKNATAKLVEQMETDLEKQRFFLKTNNHKKFLEASIHFDENLIFIANNKNLTNTVNKLNDLFTLIVMDFQYDISSKQTSIKEHSMILNSIKNNSIEETEKYIIEHCIRSTESILSKLNS